MSECNFIIEVKCATQKIARYLRRFDKYKYRFRIIESPLIVGEIDGKECTSLSISEEKLDMFHLGLHSKSNLIEIGNKLADTLFSDQEILTAFHQSIAQVRTQGHKLRLMFTYEKGINRLIPNIPWECTYCSIRPLQKEHFGVSQDVSVARFIRKTEYPSLHVQDKLTVMAVAPDPNNDFDVKKELGIMQSVSSSIGQRIDFRPLPYANWEQFKVEIAKLNPHVLIFMGHCQFIKSRPCLIFQKAEGGRDPIYASDFANVISPQAKNNLRVIMLSACQTAITVDNYPFSNAAVALIDNGFPAVIAMQSKVKDSAAMQFDTQFFNYLLNEYPLDDCVYAGRVAMLEDERDSHCDDKTQWPIPVLFLATRKNSIFNFKTTELRRLRSAMEEQFPRHSTKLIERRANYRKLEEDFPGDGITVIHGPFGAGKTQIISKLCTSKIMQAGSIEEFLCFYIQCDKRWKTFDKILEKLDYKAKSIGFQGFREILSDGSLGNDEFHIEQFNEHLSQRRLVIVFDDYIWDGAPFWQYLYLHLVNYLRVSKVYFVTDSVRYAMANIENRIIPIQGFTKEEAEAFFTIDGEYSKKDHEMMMAYSAEWNYLPWYLKIIRNCFREKAKIPNFGHLEIFVNGLSDPEREVLKQLSVLRQPIKLDMLAIMLDPANPTEFLEASSALQRQSILAFARNLEVELPINLKEYCLSQMPVSDQIQLHERAASFYQEKAGIVL